MRKATAEKVLAEIEAKYAALIEAGIYDRPNLRDADHEELSEGSFSIDWEEGPDEWCYDFETKVPGVFVEPIYSFILGVYDR